MRVLILGGNGMLGHKLVQAFGREFDTYTTIRRSFESVSRFGIFDEERTIAEVDVTDLSTVRTAIQFVKPDVLINAIGVVKQVPDAKDLEYMARVNTELPLALGEFSKELGFRLIGISTDCVFSGKKGNYVETDEPDANDAYGKTKRLGEVSSINSLTIRTSIIGRELDTAHSLVDWFLSNRGGRVSGYRGVIYSGFPTIVLAAILVSIIKKHPQLTGVYHVSSEPINKFDLLGLLNNAYMAKINIEPDNSVVIDRSLDSTRFRKSTGFAPESWLEMIEKMAADPTPYDRFKSNL